MDNQEMIIQRELNLPPHMVSTNMQAFLMVCLHPQENKPIGTTILQLSVTDQDASHNGPPFDFHILSGNEGGEFVLEKDGTLVANQVFRRDLATEYVIQIQVESNCSSTSHLQNCCSYSSLVSHGFQEECCESLNGSKT